MKNNIFGYILFAYGKTCRRLVSSIVMTALICFMFHGTAKAENFQGRMQYGLVGGEYTYYSYEAFPTEELMYDALQRWVEKEFRYPLTNERYCRDDNGYHYAIKESRLKEVTADFDALDLWLPANMPAIVPENVDKLTALSMIHTWFKTNVSYELNQKSLSTLANEKRGNCASIAGLFTAMAEYIPFSPETGLVSYSAGDDAWHFDVKYVSDDMHAYNAVCVDGSWFFFDETINLCRNSDQYFMMPEADFYSEGNKRFPMPDGNIYMREYVDMHRRYGC